MVRNYENDYVKYSMRKLLEKSINQKIIKSTKETAERNEMEKLFINDNKFIVSKKYGNTLKEKKSPYTRNEN
jgi:hypothetical protein